MGIDDIRPKADEIASLMAARFGGVRRGQQADLDSMLRRRGGALPRRLRRAARVLAEADRVAGQPKLARQVDFPQFERAHRALTTYLGPLGRRIRWQDGAARVAASVALGLLVLVIAAGVVAWRRLA
ncbi:hypothetical protein [Paracoccus aminovorans]|uniref:hypothetical protein n=1 Tax=Paracoccus aminovorans TaxID=34004 RepID=UPI002B258C66|nr:hypothetical protein [Paracoccus aminovorans]